MALERQEQISDEATGAPGNAAGSDRAVPEEATTTFTVALPAALVEQVHERAAQLGISPQAFVRISIQEMLKGHEARFQEAANYVLEKNAELYRRLA